MRKLLKVIALVLLGFVILIMTAWGTLAIYYSNLPWEPLRKILAGIFPLGTVAAFIVLKRRWRTLLGFLIVFTLLVVWFLLIPPSNEGDWQSDVAVLPTVTVNGDQITIRNIRNFEYRTETDYTPRYYDKEFDLKKLDSVDLITVYWGSEAIAHVMVSFGFGGKDYLACSIETRKQRSQSYSTIEGFFRQFALIYIVADERDVIRLRTDYRRPEEQVYIFRTRMPVENQRKLFLSYVKTIDRLAKKPSWYNTITDNCTTGVLFHTRAYPHRARYNWKILLSGYTAEYAYEIGGMDSTFPFAELRRLGYVNERAHAAGDGEDFSEKIRKGMPLPKPVTMEEFLRHQ